MRICTSCNEFKDESAFYKTSDGGIAAACKECAKARVRANYRRKRDDYREYERARALLPKRVKARAEYAASPQGRMRGNLAKRRFIERNPLKRKAHAIVGNAIRDGRLLREPCEVCGTKDAQAHHDDYGKPLEVRWLCTTHHAEWHRHNTPKCPDQSEVA